MPAATASARRGPLQLKFAIALAAITLLAAGVRSARLTTLPPGYWFDEAHKSLVALQIANGERAPIYVTDGQGIEAGYFWLLAAWFRVAGPSFFATRGLTALLGTLTIPVTYLALRELYRPLPRGRGLALLAAAWLSFLLWHVHWSRLGYETILVPLFAVALLGLMAWAWRSGTPLAFAVTGAVLGLSQYSNPGARVLVLQVAVTFWLLAQGPWRARLAHGLALGGAAFVVYLPLGLFFFNHPEWFLNRLSFTSAGARAGGWPVYAANAARTLWSLNVRGDVIPRHNLSLRPALDPLASLCMAASLGAMWAWRAQWRQHAAVLAGLGCGLLPMVFSDGAPGFGRTLGATPFLVALPALGLAFGLSRLTRRGWAVAVGVAVLGISGALNLYDYFVRYPKQPDLFDAYEVGQWSLTSAAWAASQAGTGYLLLDEPGLAHPATELARRLATGDLRILNGQACRAYPAHTEQPTTLATLAAWAPDLRAQFPQAPGDLVLHEPEIYPYGARLRLPAGSRSLTAGAPEVGRLGQSAALLAATFDPLAPAAGDTIAVALRWHVLRPLDAALNAFVHLGDPAAPPLAGADGAPCGPWYPTDTWHTDEVIEHSLPLALPVDLPPGRYPMFVGLYDWVTGQRLSASQPDGTLPDRLYLGSVDVTGE